MDLDSDIQGSDKIETAIPRQLVLDYLLHNCYGETARAFMKDDLDTVKDSDIKKGASGHALNGTNGNSNSRTSNGNLHQNGITPATSHIQGGVMARNASEDSASLMMETEKGEELDQEGDSPMGESYLDTGSSLSTSTFTTDKAQALQIDEQLKNLETRKAIRSLISHGDISLAVELCNSAFPGVLSIDPHSPLTSPASIQMNFKLQCQEFIEMVRSRSGPESGADALVFAQRVVHDFTKLDPKGEDNYVKYMGDIFTVIAYSNPEESPNAHHLKQEARDHLADIMNSAILGCNGMSCEPLLLTIVKQATLVRDYLAGDTSKTKRGLKAPARWRLSSFLEESS